MKEEFFKDFCRYIAEELIEEKKKEVEEKVRKAGE